MADEQFAHHADCDGESFELMCLGCEHARQMELMDEIERLRSLLHEARGAIFCWSPVSETGNKMQEEIINAIDAELKEKE